MIRSTAALVLLAACGIAIADGPRARDLGVPFDGAPGPRGSTSRDSSRDR